MALDIIAQKRILNDAVAGRPKEGYTPEELKFRRAADVDVLVAKKNGWVLHVPAEWEI